MCLLALALDAHPSFRLLVIANRDEFHGRASAPAGWWDENPEVLAGRDLEAGGTWLGITRSGRFAALTNFRDPTRQLPEAPSRGGLVSEFLAHRETAEEASAKVFAEGGAYNGFNLVVSDGKELWYTSNCGAGPVLLDRGIHALSNHLLDTPWPKVVRLKNGLEHLLSGGVSPCPEGFLALLEDRRVPPDSELPDTGVGVELERLLAPAWIVGQAYGTRSSTVLTVGVNGQAELVEWSRGRDGRVESEVRHGFQVEAE